MKAHSSAPQAFFHGFHPLPKVICAVGGCFFLAGFFVQTEEGVGRALGLLGIGIFLCGMITNLLLEVMEERVGSKHRRHLLAQAAFTGLLALAVLALAIYVYKYGTLPSFMPERYQHGYHLKRFG